jgi:hypothetical protein
VYVGIRPTVYQYFYSSLYDMSREGVSSFWEKRHFVGDLAANVVDICLVGISYKRMQSDVTVTGFQHTHIKNVFGHPCQGYARRVCLSVFTLLLHPHLSQVTTNDNH